MNRSRIYSTGRSAEGFPRAHDILLYPTEALALWYVTAALGLVIRLSYLQTTVFLKKRASLNHAAWSGSSEHFQIQKSTNT